MATDNLTSLPVRTKHAGDLVTTIDQTTPGVTNGVQVNAALPSGSNIIGKVGIDQTTPGTTNGVQVVAALPNGGNSIGNVGINSGSNTIGNVGVNAGTNIIGKVGIDQTTPGTTNGVQINAALPTGANVIGGVTQSGAWSFTALASTNIIGNVRIDQTTPGTTNGVQITGPGTSTSNTLYSQIMAVYNSVAPTLTNGQDTVLQTDVNGNLKVIIGGGTGSTIGNVGLNAGTNIVGKVGIDQTTPGVTNAVQITGPGTSSATPLYVNTGAGTSGTVKNSGQIASGSQIAANGGTATLAAGLITTGKVASLEHVVMSSAGPMRWDIQYIPNGGGSPVTVYTYFTNSANLNVDFDAMPGGEFTLSAADGTNAKFQVLVTNEDSSNPNYAYATLTWIEN